MNRRDLIIISALINAGLLVVLFATAIKSEPSQPLSSSPTQVSVPIPELPISHPVPVAAGDEVDQVLKEFAAHVAQAPKELEKNETESLLPPIAKQIETEAVRSFAEELAAQYPAQVQLPKPAKKRVESPSGAYKEVRVEKGDYLDRIARKNGSTVSAIMRANQLINTNLKIGQIIKIPLSKEAPATVSTASDQSYVVQDGDNPWTIARKNQMSVSELLRLNHLDERSARRLKPGDRLRIR